MHIYIKKKFAFLILVQKKTEFIAVDKSSNAFFKLKYKRSLLIAP